MDHKTTLNFIHKGKLEKKNKKELETLYSKFSEPKLDKDTLSSAFMDKITKKVMPSIRKDKRTIKDGLNSHWWNKRWR
tara:strand:- start:394 stop:627 length:234 start_codon:yes stop_codon:yes gene_type:complete